MSELEDSIFEATHLNKNIKTKSEKNNMKDLEGIIKDQTCMSSTDSNKHFKRVRSKQTK